MRKLPHRGVHRARGTLRALARGAARPDGRIEAFEREAASFFEVEHAIATGSGREAQALILTALDLEPGDQVLLPALSFEAVPRAVEKVGLEVVYVDVSESTLQMDTRALAQRAGARARVVIATHLYGLACDLDELGDVAARHDLSVVEDFAQAAGARYRGRRVGSFGRASFTSLETVKPLTAFGGGLITTSDADLARRIRSLASASSPPDLGKLGKKILMAHAEAALSTPLGFGVIAWPLLSSGERSADLVARYKRRKAGAGNRYAALHPMQAEVARNSLAHLDAHLAARRSSAEALRTRLPDGCWKPPVVEGTEPSWYQVLVRVTDVARCREACRKAGVDLGVGVVADLSAGECPTAALLAPQLVQVPCHPTLTSSDLDHVAETLSPWLA